MKLKKRKRVVNISRGDKIEKLIKYHNRILLSSKKRNSQWFFKMGYSNIKSPEYFEKIISDSGK